MITTTDYNTEISITPSPPIKQPLQSICVRKSTHLSHNCGVSLIVVEMKAINLSYQDLKVQCEVDGAAGSGREFLKTTKDSASTHSSHKVIERVHPFE
jgi:hypothetical protein